MARLNCTRRQDNSASGMRQWQHNVALCGIIPLQRAVLASVIHPNRKDIPDGLPLTSTSTFARASLSASRAIHSTEECVADGWVASQRMQGTPHSHAALTPSSGDHEWAA